MQVTKYDCLPEFSVTIEEESTLNLIWKRNEDEETWNSEEQRVTAAT